MTPTPRTDDNVRIICSPENNGMGIDYSEEVVEAEFVRELEREIIELETRNTQLLEMMSIISEYGQIINLLVKKEINL